MFVAEKEIVAGSRPSTWKWLVCGLLLLATMLNYMDRLTINLTARKIQWEMGLNDEQYGEIERAFGVGFAFGALLMGWSADRWTIRWLYPVAVLAWSAAGFATGFAQSFLALMLCRCALGIAEAGNWPCALRTTQHILPPSQRTMGNSILQSGAAVGAILTPIVVWALVHKPADWRYPFFAVGTLGTFWVFLWLFSVQGSDLPAPRSFDKVDPAGSRETLWRIYAQPRFFVLMVVVIAINLTWHFFRVWLPLYLQKNLYYSSNVVYLFTSAYYVATDIGALLAGFMTLYFVRRGVSVHGSRVLVFLGGTLLTTLSAAVPIVGQQVSLQPLAVSPEEGQELVRSVDGAGWLLLGMLLLIGLGSLALFPVYYSLSQELTVRNQGKVTGSLGFCTWMATAFMHPLVGRWLDWTRAEQGVSDYQSAVALAGLIPLVGLLTLYFFWGKEDAAAQANDDSETCATA